MWVGTTWSRNSWIRASLVQSKYKFPKEQNNGEEEKGPNPGPYCESSPIASGGMYTAVLGIRVRVLVNCPSRSFAMQAFPRSLILATSDAVSNTLLAVRSLTELLGTRLDLTTIRTRVKRARCSNEGMSIWDRTMSHHQLLREAYRQMFWGCV